MERAGLPAQRRPWYWLVVIAVFALAAIMAVYQNMRSRIQTNEQAFAVAQRFRLANAEQRIDYFFGAAEQIARIGAHTMGAVVGNLPLTRLLVAETFRARETNDVYGIGVFYQPYAFDPGIQMVSVYDRAGRTEGLHGTPPAHASDYTQSLWFRRAVASPGDTSWAGPYTDRGVSYISTLRAVKHNGRVVGAFTVDILTSHFKALLDTDLEKGDIAWVQSGVNGRRLVGTAALPADSAATRIATKMPLHFTGAILHISTDATALRRGNQRIEILSLLLVLFIAASAFVVVRVITQRWQREEETRELHDEQSRLEGEIDVARRIEAELRKAAYTDSLTGLPNRTAYMDSVRALLGDGGKQSHTVFLVDIDRFNLVNETMGHIAGDGLLRVLAARLVAGMPKSSLVARLGGDEFVVVVAAHGEAITSIAARILELIGEPVLFSGQMLQMRASIGVAPIDGTYENPEELLRDADIAMYHAKAQGRDRFEIFDTTMRARVARESLLESALRRAIDRGEFVAHYQPVIRIATGAIASFEALVRWQGPSERISAASEFVPFAESRGLSTALDAIMLRNVCSQMPAITAMFPETSIAANISAAELASPELPDYIAGLLREYHVPAKRLKLEITETAMMKQASAVQATLDGLRKLGIALILDDFGTGYSSLSYLRQLPIVGLKIDQSFVENLARDTHSLEIVRSIVALAGSLGLDTTAEGVENEGQLVILTQLGVTFAQGFLFSKALYVGALVSLQNLAATREA